MQMLAKLSSNLLQKTGGDQSGGREQLEWKNFHNDPSLLDLGIYESRDQASLETVFAQHCTFVVVHATIGFAHISVCITV